MRFSLRSWLWSVPLDQEVDEELAFHVEMRTRELIDRGVDPRVAREMVLARIGDVRRLRKTCVGIGRKREREMRVTQWLDEVRGDLRFALRQLRRSPGFATVAVITLALGIGANSAMFALADAMLLRPLPFRDPERVVLVSETLAAVRGCCAVVAPLNLRDWRERNRSFTAIAGMSYGAAGRRLVARDGTVELVTGFRVTEGFFDVLGVSPLAGRLLAADDYRENRDVVVLNEAFWRGRYDADPSIVGREMRIDGRPYTVVGVVPAAAQALGASSFWTPYQSPPGLDERALHFLRVVGRLRPGATIESARGDMAAIADALAAEYPATNKGRGVRIDPLREWVIRSEVRLTSALLLGAVGFVVLICCANIASLLLAKTSARARELAVRSAIGAGRRRIVAQIVTESLTLAAIGGVLALGVGAIMLRVAPAAIPQGLLPAAITLALDARVVTFCVASTLLVGAMFGIVPALHATGLSVIQVIRAEDRAVTGGGRMRGAIVVAEVAAAVLLLCGAGLLLRTLAVLDTVDAGYGASNVLTLRLAPGGVEGSAYDSPESMRRFYANVAAEVAMVPGVQRVAWGKALPLDHDFTREMTFELEGDPPRPQSSRPAADIQNVSPEFFSTLGIPIIRGRGFTDRDTDGSQPVCLVNEAFVRQHLKGRDPIGLRVIFGQSNVIGPRVMIAREIVGVVRQVRGRADEREEPVHIYVPLAQDINAMATLVVRPRDARAEALTAAVRAAIARIDRDLPVTNVRTMDEIAWQATARPRFRAITVALFGMLSLGLALVGVFGVLAYSVQQRSREFGVRIALGASTQHVLGLVLGGAARLVAAGLVIGLIAAALLGRWMAAFLYGVPALDPITFAAVAGVMAITAVVAIASPAIRAARVDPVVAFRSE